MTPRTITAAVRAATISPQRPTRPIQHQTIEVLLGKPTRRMSARQIEELRARCRGGAAVTAGCEPDWWGKCKCWRPGWLEGHDDPKCEFRDRHPAGEAPQSGES